MDVIEEAIEIIRKRRVEFDIIRIKNDRSIYPSEKRKQIIILVPELKSWPNELFKILFRELTAVEKKYAKEAAYVT